MKSISISPLKPITFIISRYQVTLFFLFIMAGLIAAVLLLNSIITDSTLGENYTSPISAGSIDQATLDRLQSLHTSNEKFPAESHPQGRLNPFSE
jgi:hypothetical protein